jgi:hypothetical protein
MIRSLLTAYGFWFLLAVAVHAQGQLGSSGKVRPSKDKPTVYLTYDRSGLRVPLNNGESKKGIWLRLHNNTKWKLVLRVGGVPNSSYGDAVVFYEVERREGSGFTPIGYRSHVASVIKLKAGNSIVFSLPQEHLEKGLAIRVRYSYEWELGKNDSLSSNEPYHSVTFTSSDLPMVRR